MTMTACVTLCVASLDEYYEALLKFLGPWLYSDLNAARALQPVNGVKISK